MTWEEIVSKQLKNIYVIRIHICQWDLAARLLVASSQLPVLSFDRLSRPLARTTVVKKPFTMV